MTDVLEIIREPAGEPVVEFPWLSCLYRVSSNAVEQKCGEGEWNPLNTASLASYVLRAYRIALGKEPPADEFELKQEQGKVMEIRRANGASLWWRFRDGSACVRADCTDDEFIAIGDILKGEKRD